MPAKDVHGKNLLRMDRVFDERDVRQGTVMGSGHANQVVIDWDDGEEETTDGTNVRAARKGLSR
jgi:hypothetical protein